MKAAVRHLEPSMERSGAASRGRFVIATVKGDVHDIGKNLVDIILTNNGYTVDNLGIKVPVEQLIEAVRRDRPAAVGMSGLLVKSTLVMRDNLDAFNEAGLDLPVILGGAALTRLYVERDLRRLYQRSRLLRPRRLRRPEARRRDQPRRGAAGAGARGCRGSRRSAGRRLRYDRYQARLRFPDAARPGRAHPATALLGHAHHDRLSTSWRSGRC